MDHVIKPLKRNPLMPLIVALQVAIACAIACNALFLLQQRLAPILAPDGISQPDHLIMVGRVVARGEPFDVSRLRQLAKQLRALPGVAAVSVAGSLPMVTNARMNGAVEGLSSGAEANAAMYIGTHMVDTLGLELVAGRDFSAVEEAVRYQGIGLDRDGPTIISRNLAEHLFPGQAALGQRIRIGDETDSAQRTVVGVVAHLMRNDFATGDHPDLGSTLMIPGIPNQWPIPSIAVRVAEANPVVAMESVRELIQRALGPKLVQGIEPTYQSYASLRDAALARPRAAVWLLSSVCVVVLIVTLAGIMGLTSYWVGQRTRQIGIRRALGARRRDILRHLQLENLWVVGLGVALGMVAAYAINLWLMQHYELSRLPWQYLPLGAAIMWLLGQIAVLGPALRAAEVPPVVATRSV